MLPVQDCAMFVYLMYTHVSLDDLHLQYVSICIHYISLYYISVCVHIMCMCVYIYIYISTHVHVYIKTFFFDNTRTYMYTYTQIHVLISILISWTAGALRNKYPTSHLGGVSMSAELIAGKWNTVCECLVMAALYCLTVCRVWWLENLDLSLAMN